MSPGNIVKYFKNTELAKLYNVSEKSVRNWIHAASEGKLDLELYNENNRFHIANTSQNTFEIEQLVKKGKKYKNSRSFKVVTPTLDFYKRYNNKQIFDIIANIDIYREVPHQYSYFNSGAKHWDTYTHKLMEEKLPNSLTDTIELLDLNTDYLNALIGKYDGVNVVDIGVGNGLPVKNLLQHLAEKKLLRRYIALDTSHDMLDIARKNITDWFGDGVRFEGYIKDANYDKFESLLIGDTFNKGDQSILNMVLFLGGTIANLREADMPLRTIRNSLGKDDLFILSRKLDTPASRRFFDFAAGTEDSKLKLKEKIILDMLGVDESFYTVEQFFDETQMARVIQVKLNIDLSIKFELEGNYRIIELNKGESILLWRATHQKMRDVLNQLEGNGFENLQATRSISQQYLQVISKIKLS